ncbi:MerR family transcriptional regulator [Clostridium sp. HV4-5-A1G]|uniref:MerR family transcriptional regulator n=1 Tax=Clostridium sp. HV4-5-A1G TaxID=2004595 RepID=UPI0016883F20|nr:MerR family transcriptional regulator [Clostridium sp. HV4-5-A1G]
MGKKAYTREAAKELGLTEYQLRRRVREHKIPVLTSGNRYVFDIELCEKFLEKQALKNTEPPIQNVKKYGVLRKIEG